MRDALPTMRVLVPDDPERRELEPLPAGVELGVIGGSEPRLDDVEMLVAAPHVEELAGLLGRLPALRVVQAVSAGVDWLLPLVPEGVVVCDAAGVHDTPVAEWVLAAILASLRRIPECRDVQRGERDSLPRQIELAGRRVLILGYGSIGRAVEARLTGFDVELTRVARSTREGVHATSELPSLLPRTDVLVLLLPLTAETERMVDRELLGRLPDGALVVNAGRGRLVDQPALLTELESGRLHAALDVTDPEPLPREDPLWNAPGTLITPHVAGDSPVPGPRLSPRPRPDHPLRRRRATAQRRRGRLLTRGRLAPSPPE